MKKNVIAAAVVALGLSGCSSICDESGMTFWGSYEPGSHAEFMHMAGDRVFFALNSFSLTAESKTMLDKMVAWLKKNDGAKITVEGHTDERGAVEYNIALGNKRAHAVVKYLTMQGVDKKRINVVSYGKERPEVMGHGESAWSQNRRAVVVVS